MRCHHRGPNHRRHPHKSAFLRLGILCLCHSHFLYVVYVSGDGTIVPGSPRGDWKISAVWSWSPPEVNVHMSPLHERAVTESITILLAEFERAHATAKDTKW